uniref:golvesin C-terminal-like domain-containing protein n=1 Tax=Neorhodopirellula lusitana TaxID=445327 RepID=UPI00384BE0E5
MVTVDQTQNGGVFQSLGVFSFASGQSGSIAIKTLGANGTVVADSVRLVPVTSTTIQLDNSNPAFAIESGNWAASSSALGFIGTDYRYASGGDKTARFTPTIASAGTYEVFANWASHPSRATNAPIEVVHEGGTSVVTVDQTQNGGIFQSLGIFSFDAGQSGSIAIKTLGANGSVVADAVRLVPETSTTIQLDNSNPAFAIERGNWGASSSVTGFVGTDYRYASGGNKTVRFTPTIATTGAYEVFANWTSHPSRATNAPIEIVYDGGTSVVNVDQTQNGGAFQSIGIFTFAAGQSGSIAIGTLGANGAVVADAVRFVPVSGGMAAMAAGPSGDAPQTLALSGPPTEYSELDVDRSLDVTPLDALLIVNYVQRQSSFTSRESESVNFDPELKLHQDVNGDGAVTALDALIVINYLSGHRSQAASVTPISSPESEQDDNLGVSVDWELPSAVEGRVEKMVSSDATITRWKDLVDIALSETESKSDDDLDVQETGQLFQNRLSIASSS